MAKSLSFSWNNSTFILSALKCLFWVEEEALLLSDLHLGKTNHFRKNGIAISSEVANIDYINLELAINEFNPKKIIVIGDLFHSKYNNEVNFFGEWKKPFEKIEWILVKGNHDMLSPEIFNPLSFRVVNSLQISNTILVHEVDELLLKTIGTNNYITGHVHPGVKVKLGVHQQSFPCFFFSQNQLILPAFGKFTGIHLLKPKKSNSVFCIVNDSIIAYK